jgi:hypothetical protein
VPHSFNGFGTTYYGKRHAAGDGSYVTTLWITALYVPLLPLRSYRVLPVGEGTNLVVHRSQNYRVVRVPLCWAQVRNVYLCGAPILALIFYFAAPDIQKWWKEDVLKLSDSAISARSPLKPEPIQAEASLSDMDAAVACGKVLKLDKDAFKKLNLIDRMSRTVDESSFTADEIEELGDSRDQLQQEAFSAYSLAYLTWEKPRNVSRASLDKMVMDVVNSVTSSSPDLKNLSASERAQLDTYLVKFKRMMLKAFDLGRHDARLSPCKI